MSIEAVAATDGRETGYPLLDYVYPGPPRSQLVMRIYHAVLTTCEMRADRGVVFVDVGLGVQCKYPPQALNAGEI